MLQVNEISQNIYETMRWDIIRKTEGRKDTPYYDTNEIPTIGYGYNLSDENILEQVFLAFGFDIAGLPQNQEQAYKDEIITVIEGPYLGSESNLSEALDKIMKLRSEAYNNQNIKVEVRTSFAFSSGDTGYQEMKAVFDSDFVQGRYERSVRSFLGFKLEDYLYAGMPRSKERAVLFSLSYNGILAGSPSLRRAITENNNRAEAWYEIRYNSNGGDSRGDGIAKRRYYESTIFGLYNDSENVSDEEAAQVLQMYLNHKDGYENGSILSYEDIFGHMVQHANNDYETSATNYSFDDTVLAFGKLFLPITDYLIREYSEEYLSNFNINIDGEVKIDALEEIVSSHGDYNDLLIGVDGKQNHIRGNEGDDILIGGNNKDDLYGGLGNDILEGQGGDDYLHGGVGDDRLYGGLDSDRIYGGDGTDYLDGGTGIDFLYGGSGFDYYYADDGDTISDSDKNGIVIFEGTRLSHGVWNEELNAYEGNAGKYTYHDSTLIFENSSGGSVTILNYSKAASDLNITLEDDKKDPNQDPQNQGGAATVSFSSPLVFDLNQNGVTSTSLYETTTYFDLDADGFKQRTGWVEQEDGFLTLDRNANGIVDDGTELFGNYTRDEYGNPFSEGFAALKSFDKNHDNQITKGDDIYENLRIWTDLNADGVSQAEELKSLSDLHITTISLSAQQIDGTEGRNTVT
ncbi:MAG: hypothetical protein K9L59_14130, partial [Desulfobacterales bacterium]|nr:hypothetical protein [Desulfobacterales bacterium]